MTNPLDKLENKDLRIANAILNESRRAISVALELNESASLVHAVLHFFCKNKNKEAYLKILNEVKEMSLSIDSDVFLEKLRANKHLFIASTDELMKEADNQGNWQPLETAPKDGTRFLIRLDGDNVTLARFNYADPDYPLEFIDSQSNNDFFINTSQVGVYCITKQWQPLPN
ncbi:MAG: hypothetical protein IPM57_10785 [Oligoflexia bacterium]|nr:hypothetical protein [Oligoflexia bacterium]